MPLDPGLKVLRIWLSDEFNVFVGLCKRGTSQSRGVDMTKESAGLIRCY